MPSSKKLRKAVDAYVDSLHDQLHGRAYNITEPVSREQFKEELMRRHQAINRLMKEQK